MPKPRMIQQIRKRTLESRREPMVTVAFRIPHREHVLAIEIARELGISTSSVLREVLATGWRALEREEAPELDSGL